MYLSNELWNGKFYHTVGIGIRPTSSPFRVLNAASCAALKHLVAWKPFHNYGTSKDGTGDGRRERDEHNESCEMSGSHTKVNNFL